MATITIRTDGHTDVILEELEKAHSSWRIKKNTIIKAAIQAFGDIDEIKRCKYITQVIANDGRWRRTSFY